MFEPIGKYLALFCLGGFIAIGLADVALSETVDSKYLGWNGGSNPHPHNLSSSNTSGSGAHAPAGGEDEICKFCHTPHSGSTKGPLWNRKDPIGPNGDGTFPLYGELSGRLDEIAIDDAAIVNDSQYGVGEYPNGASRLCMSCHDGVTAIGEVLNGGTLADINFSSNQYVIDLDASHPVSFVYNAAVETYIEANQPGATDQYTLPAAGSGYLDSQDRMQCTTCHDPHVDTRDGSGYINPMWRDYGVGVDDNADYEYTCSICHVDGSSSGGLERGGNDPHNF